MGLELEILQVSSVCRPATRKVFVCSVCISVHGLGLMTLLNNATLDKMLVKYVLGGVDGTSEQAISLQLRLFLHRIAFERT